MNIPEVLINGMPIQKIGDIFPSLISMLTGLCKQFSFNNISLTLVKNQKYLFDYCIPGEQDTYAGKTLERTVMSQIHSDPYVNYTFLETIDLAKFLNRAETGGSPYKLVMEGGYYQIYDDDSYINDLICKNLLIPDHRKYKLADYTLFKSDEGFRRNYRDFSDFYKKLVLPLCIRDGELIQLFGHVIIDQFRLPSDPSTPLDKSYIDKLMVFFNEFTLQWKVVIEQFNKYYMPIFNHILDLESRISQFEDPPFTMAHLDNVAVFFLYFLKWANATRKLSLTQENLFYAYMGARFHDAGKVKIPIAILNKKTPLTPEERRVIERHSQWGIELLEGADISELANDIILLHHVYLDGTGYPCCEKKLPLIVRMFVPVDIFEALVSLRPYKRKYSMQKAFAILREMACNGKIDCDCVEWLIEYTNGLKRTGREFMKKNHIVVTDDQSILFDFLESIEEDSD